MSKLSWLAMWCGRTGAGRMCTWVGETADIVVTGLDDVDLGNAPTSFELPPGARIYGVVQDRAGGRRLAASLGGVLFTVFQKHAVELLLEEAATPRTFVPATYEQLAAHRRILERYPDGVIPLRGEPPEPLEPEEEPGWSCGLCGAWGVGNHVCPGPPDHSDD